ncbi:MAG: MipA/OmpV family protein [Nevskia sp.]|nr:MipA/OmpV family protein [Nevskia sp.]
MRRAPRGAPVVLLAALAAAAAHADHPAQPQDGPAPPLWELGIAGAVGTVADYPASDRYRVRALPFPYFVYRGRVFRSDESGARVRASWRQNWELEVSGSASFATHSSGSGPRAGMPDLDYLLELGPKLKYRFARPEPTAAWFLELPLRAVISTNGHSRLDYRGLTFSPDLGARQRGLFGTRWNGYFDLGPEFASGRFQDYFYQVDPIYARPGRPAYDAHGGYFGARLELGVNRPIARGVHVFFYSRLEDYHGAANAGSPLFQTHFGYTGFVGLSWSFLRSREAAAVPEAP